MKKQLYLILAITFILSLAMVSAADTLGTFKQSSCVNLLQTCSNCTFNNITSVNYPDGTQALGNVAMQKIGTEYNYTLCNTAQLGTYNVNGIGDLDGANTIWRYTLDINPTGTIQNSVLNNPTLLIFLILAIALLIIALVVKNFAIGFLSGLMFIISGVYTMIYGFNNSADDYSRMIATILIAIGMIFTMAAGYDAFTDGSISKKVKDEEEEFE